MTRSVALFLLLTMLGVLGHVRVALALACDSTGTNTWSTVGIWSCGRVPIAGDDVTIALGHTVTLNQNSASLASLNVIGTLTIGNDATARTLTVAGNIAVSGTMSTGATNATHILLAGGDISNSGTINLRPTATRVCNVTFNRNGNQTVSGAGAYTFNLITVNMGASRANILDMQAAMTTPSPFLTITNGTYRHSNASAITPWTADPSIPANGGFWLNSAATVTTAGFNVTINGGQFRISAGTMTIGNTNTTVLSLANVATTLFQMDGGTLTVTGGINSSVNTGAGTFTMSGGTITLMSISAGAVYTFLLGSATTLNWSGGTIIAVNGNASTDDVDIRSATQSITGGTLQMGSAATTSANDISYINGAGGQLNVWNLVLASGPARNHLMRSSTNILNDLTIQALNNLQPSAGLAINVGAGNAGGNWTNNGTFTQSTTTVTFTGTANANIAGTTANTFYKLTINKTALAGVTIANATNHTVSNQLTFTSGTITTGANILITTPACNAATPPVSRTSGHVIGNLRKAIPAGASTCTFEIGSGSNYTPLVLTFVAGTGAGNITASTTATDHPQLATSSIDGANSVNRYWTLTNGGVVLPAAGYSATFNFINGSPVDADNLASVGGYIVQQWSGGIWAPTTLAGACTAAPAGNLCKQINGETGFGDFAIGFSLSGVSGSPGDFNAFESSTPASSILGRIYTKIVGAAITIDVVAVNPARTGVLTTYNTNPITVELLDARDNTGALNATTACRTSWSTVIQTQTISPVWASGRTTVTITAPANAGRDVRVRVTRVAGPLLQGCSTDRFAIRPTAFSSITSNMNNNATSGAPVLRTGQNFTISALTGLAGYDNGSGATLASPQIVPLIDNTKVVGSPTAGSIGGVFTAASAGTAAGASFFYSEVGNFGLGQYAIYDNVFTAVDQPTDCTADFSNTLVGGQYGCSFGSAAIAQTPGVSGFGRFIPDNFSVTPNAPQFGAACAAGGFGYVGQSFSYATAPAINVTARNGTSNGLTNATTANYAGAYMKLSNAAGSSLNQAPYNTQPGRYSRFDALGGGTTPALNTAGLPATTADPAIGAFAGGMGTLTFGSGTGLSFVRSTTTPNAPFNADIALTLNIVDTDGVAFAGNPVSFGAATAGNGIAYNSGKVMRFGRLVLGSAHGSAQLALAIPVEAQYWSGLVWTRNVLDSCTALNTSTIAMGNYKGALNATNMPAASLSVPGALAAGRGSLSLAKPTDGSTGSVDLSINLGAVAGAPSCTATVGWVPAASSVTGANMDYLRDRWCLAAGRADDPFVRATFGIYRDKFIYRRESY